MKPLSYTLLSLAMALNCFAQRDSDANPIDPTKAVLEVVQKYEIDIDLSKRLVYNGNVLFSPLGQLGAWAFSSKEERGLTIFETTRAGSARSAGLKKWDRIISVNGKRLGTIESTNDEGPIVLFGHELDEAESGKQVLELEVMRDGEETPIKVTVKLRYQRDMFETSDPLTGEKADRLEELAIKQLLDRQDRSGKWKSNYGTFLAGIALLSTGNPKYRTELRKCADACIDMKETKWTWELALNTIFLSEYFWATGDMKVFRKLEELSEELSKCVGPTGGIGHWYAQGTYESDNFGAASCLVQLAWSACAQCLVAVNTDKRNLNFDRILGSPVRKNSNNVNYAGDAYSGRIGESAFRTGAFGLSLALSRWEPTVLDNITKMMANNYKSFRYIHATPSQGTIFSSLFLSKANKEAYNKYLRYVKWRMTVAWENDKTIHYIYPKKASFNFELDGGGWDGDGYIGLDLLALIEPIIVLNAKNNCLLMQGNREMGWLKGKDAEESKDKIRELHKEEFASNLKQAEQYVRSGATNQANRHLEVLESHYDVHATRPTIEKIRRDLREERNWPRAEKKIIEDEAEEYFVWAMQLEYTIRGKFLEKLIEEYPDTRGAHKAEGKLKGEESRSRREQRDKEKEEKEQLEELERKKKEEEKNRRRLN